jgi:hypothetical protein
LGRYLPRPIANRLARAAGSGVETLDAVPDSAPLLRAVALQPVAAGEAVGEALADPTLANVTNAGYQTAITFGRPLAALGIGGAGYLEAARRDAGLTIAPSAEAAAKDKKTQRVYEGLNADQSARLDELRAKIEARTASRAERQEFEGLNSIVTDLQRQRNAASAQEIDRQVQAAEAAKAREMARDRRFSETDVGRIYEKTGGLAPMAFGAATGALSRLATGGRSNLAYNYALPGAAGSAAGLTAANLPLMYNSVFTESVNPEKAAYLAYARELPDGHPRKRAALEYAASLPDENPVRVNAAREFYDPVKLGERAIMGGVEGLLGGLLGADVVRIAGRPVDRLLSLARKGEDASVPAARQQRRVIREVEDVNGVVRYYDATAKRWVKKSDVEQP